MKEKPVRTYLVLIAIMAFVSCSKQDQPPQQRVGIYPPHPMAGSEIQFDSLVWEPDEYVKNAFIYIYNRPDLFMPFWKLDLSLRLDTSSVWLPVSLSNGFMYHLGPGSLVIATAQADSTLEGTYASVKIKFQ